MKKIIIISIVVCLLVVLFFVNAINAQYDVTTGTMVNSFYTGGSWNTPLIFQPSVIPEPISSILFVTGGAVLAGRRYLRRKK